MAPEDGKLPPFTRDAYVAPRDPPGTYRPPAAPYPTPPSPQPFGTVGGGYGSTGPVRPPGTDWDEVGWSNTSAFGLRGRRALSMPRAHFDTRAVFVFACSLLVLVMCFVAWFELRVIGTTASTPPAALNQTFSYTVLSSPYGGWRILLPIVAGLAAVLALVNMFFRSGDRGAVAGFSALRLVALIELGLVIAVLVTRGGFNPHNIQGVGTTEFVVELTAAAWIALGAAAVGAFGSLASSGKVVDTTGR